MTQFIRLYNYFGILKNHPLLYRLTIFFVFLLLQGLPQSPTPYTASTATPTPHFSSDIMLFITPHFSSDIMLFILLSLFMASGLFLM